MDDTATPSSTSVPAIDLPSEAFDAVLDELATRDPGEPLRFEGFTVETEASNGDATTYRLDPAGDEPQTGLSEAALHEALDARAPAVTDWYAFERAVGEFGPRRAFLRWIEDADGETVATRYAALAEGITRAWGELRITATVTDRGARRYDVRHVDDAGTPVGDLDRYEFLLNRSSDL